MAEDEIITATDASRNFSDLLHRICYGGESFVIKKGNRLMARITPVEADVPQKQSKPKAEKKSDPIAEIMAAITVPIDVSDEEAEYLLAVMEGQHKKETA